MARNTAVDKLKEFIEDESICERIEASVYEYTLEKAKERCIKQDLGDMHCRRIYVNKLHQIYTNMDPESYVQNKFLLDRIVNEEIDVDRIAFLSPCELNYEAWKDMMSKQQAGEDFIQNAVLAGTRTSEFTCGRCKANDCTYNFVNCRSLDEPAVCFISCLNCKKKWRI